MGLLRPPLSLSGSVASVAQGCDLVLAADCVYEGDDGDTSSSFLAALEEALYTASVPHAIVVYKRKRLFQLELAEGFLATALLRFEVVEISELSLVLEHRDLGVHVLHLRPRAGAGPPTPGTTWGQHAGAV